MTVSLLPSRMARPRSEPVKDQFYGDRSGTITDPFGHVWTIATHNEDVRRGRNGQPLRGRDEEDGVLNPRAFGPTIVPTGRASLCPIH